MQFLRIPHKSLSTSISCGRFVAPPGWQHSRRQIDSYVLLLGMQGSIFIEQDEQAYELLPGQIMLLLPGHQHSGYRPSHEGASYYWCHFYCDDSAELVSMSELQADLGRHQAGNRNGNIYLPVYLPLHQPERIAIIYRQLIHAHMYNHYAQYQTNLCLASIGAEITEQAFQYYSRAGQIPITNRFNEVMEWVRIHYNKQLEVNEIAARFNYNANYFSRLFKSKVGVSLIRYVNQLKVDKAKYLLVNSDLTVKEIAYQIGISDEKYFMKLFRQNESLTPTQYRNAFSYTHLNNH